MAEFLNFRDMFDGGGAGKSGDRFEGGGLWSMLGNSLFKPAGYAARQQAAPATSPRPQPRPGSSVAPQPAVAPQPVAKQPAAPITMEELTGTFARLPRPEPAQPPVMNPSVPQFGQFDLWRDFIDNWQKTQGRGW